jgi:signal transduction histidine kinase
MRSCTTRCRAAARTTALIERFLRRISADLHDGPGQDLAVALLRFESLASGCSHGIALQPRIGARRFPRGAFRAQSALTDLQAISAGLQLPEIDLLNIDEVARAVRDYERKTNARSDSRRPATCDASLPVRITLYRLLQNPWPTAFGTAAALASGGRVIAATSST